MPLRPYIEKVMMAEFIMNDKNAINMRGNCDLKIGEKTLIHGGEIYDKNIELDFSVNLNPYPCPDKVMEKIQEASLHICEYPDIEQKAFREKVAMAENKLSGSDYLTAENVIGGNGASELIMAIIRLINPKKVLMAVPCFYGYYHGIKALSDIEVAKYFLSEEKNFELQDDFTDYIDDSIDMVILGNPNNPTGRLIEGELLERIIRKCNETGTAVLIDECFLHLSSLTIGSGTKGNEFPVPSGGAFGAAKYLDLCDNLFIVNAYTKLFSIPGVRVGYALAAKERIEALKALLPEWNMSVMAQRAGEACAETIVNTDYVDRSKEYVKYLRNQMVKDLGEPASGAFEESIITFYPSDTNFILVKSGKRLYDFFLSNGILIRDCSGFEGLSEGFYRFAVRDEKSYERMKECFYFLI